MPVAPVSRVEDAVGAGSEVGRDLRLLGIGLARAEQDRERDEHLVRRRRDPRAVLQALERVADAERQAARARVDDLERQRAARAHAGRAEAQLRAIAGRPRAVGQRRVGDGGSGPEETGVDTVIVRSRSPTRSE